jgi:hypothetical protein
LNNCGAASLSKRPPENQAGKGFFLFFLGRHHSERSSEHFSEHSPLLSFLELPNRGHTNLYEKERSQ